MINRDNYELYLTDYADGTLAPELRNQVEAFLLKNPDIAAEFELFTGAEKLSPPGAANLKAELLQIPFTKETANSDFFQEQCVLKLENQLTGEQSRAFETALQHDTSKQREWQWFEQTRLKAEGFGFDEKLTMKQGPIHHYVTSQNLDEYCIASMEGWLDHNGQLALNRYFEQHPELQSVMKAFYNTRLSADLSVVFEPKWKLKRWVVLKAEAKRYAVHISAAAAILVFGALLVTTSRVDMSQLAGSVTQTEHQLLQNQNPVKVSQHQNSVQFTDAQTNEELVLTYPKKAVKREVHGPKQSQNEPFDLNPIIPKGLSTVSCGVCPDQKLAMQAKTNAELAIIASVNQNPEKENQPQNSQSLLKSLTQTGIENLNKMTDGTIKITEKPEDNKTRIAINTRYFAFETNIKNKKK